MFNALANLGRGNPDNRVRVCVVIGVPPKDLHAQNTLFELVGLARQHSRDYVSEETGVPFTGIEKRSGQQLFELLLDGAALAFARRCPTLRRLLW